MFSTSARLQKTEDLITSAYLNQLKDLISKQKAAGGTLVNSSPEIKKQLDEQLNRLAQKFKLASSDVVGKLHVEFEKVALQSSVAAVTEGRSIDDLLKQVKKSQAEYEKERAAKKTRRSQTF